MFENNVVAGTCRLVKSDFNRPDVLNDKTIFQPSEHCSTRLILCLSGYFRFNYVSLSLKHSLTFCKSLNKIVDNVLDFKSNFILKYFLKR